VYAQPMRSTALPSHLLALSLLPAAMAATLPGCFSSTNASPTTDAGLDGTSPGDAQGQVDGPSGDATGPLTDAAADQAAPPPSAGGSGAFGIVTINGKEKMYLPEQYVLANGNASIAVVDVSAPGNGYNGAPAQITQIDLGTTNNATATGGDSNVVIAVSTQNNSVYFIDPNTDTLTKTLQLDTTMFGRSGFSGGGGFVTGVAVDSVHNRAILSVFNGFALVDLTTKTITSVIQAPPSENFGFDSVHQRIIAPFYDCTSSDYLDDAGNYLVDDAGNSINPSACTTPQLPEGGVMTEGLSVIDLTDDTVYTYQASTTMPEAGGGGYFSYDPTTPVGSEPDSAAVDPTTGIVVLPSEGNDWQNIIDLSQATFDKSTKTVTAPQSVILNLDLQGAAVEPNHHLAFLEEEGGSTVGVFNLSQANANGGNTPVVVGTMPTAPGGGGFQNIGDPHGIAVTTSLSTAGPVGFVVDSGYQWVARVDIAGMLAAGGPDGAVMLDDLQMAQFVTFLDALTPENPSEAGTDAAGE
jgi:hypothetical protein